MPMDKIIGKNFDEVLPPDLSERFKNIIRVLIASKKVQSTEYSLNIESVEKWFQATFTLFYKENDKSPKVSVLVRDITEKKEFIMQLIEAKEVAEKSKKQESQFLSNMSHEIRTPLYGVIGLTEIILLETLENKVRKNTELIKYSAGNLLSIVNDILDYSKIENEKIDIRHDDFSLKELSDHLIKTTESLVREKNIELLLEIDSSIPERILGDALRLGQVLQNLLTNAAKFTESGYIKLKISQIKKDIDLIQLEFLVEDTGIGIQDSELDTIFTAYFQKDNRSLKIKGTGLGLAITKKIVEIFQGEISVGSEIGRGTRFKVILDFALQKSETNLKITSEPMNDNAFDGVLALLVDDYEMNRFVGSEILKNWGTIVEFAEEGLEAIQKTKNKKYDIIIMDIQMPSMSGDEVASMIRADNNNLNQNTPIIALSADVFEEIKIKALKAGMNDFINKPFQLEELYNAIKRNLAS
jgi:signal transduction histidine kinase/CheY-like chemotaxis protein